MNTKNLLSSILLLSINNAFVLGQGSPWFTTGNGGITTSNFLGSTNSAPLIFRTANTQRMRITPGGFVGIGTNNPFAPLQVHSPFAGLSQFTNSGTTAGSGRGFFVGNLSTTAYLWQAENAPLILATTGTERMRITPTDLYNKNINGA